MTGAIRAILIAAAAAVLMTLGVSSALAKKKTVSCGDVITHSIKVKNDLIDCPGNGLVIGAAHVKVDLGGHTIDGVNNPAADGIANTGGFDNVVIRHGTIQQFQQGVHLVSASRNKLEQLAV